MHQMIVGPTGRILQSNQATDRLFGYESGSLAGRHMADVLSVATVAELNGYIEAPAVSAIIEEISGRTANGDRILLRVDATAWTDTEDGLYHALILRDIAAEANAERLSRTELERANHAIKGAGIATWDYDCVNDTVAVCDIWREILQISSHESDVVQREWLSRTHPDDHKRIKVGFQKLKEGKCERYKTDYRLRSKDGSRWIWIHSDLAIAERDRDGKVTRLSGAMTDITKRKATEDALRRSVERFRSSFESAAVGMAIIGIDGSFLQVNPALSDLLGYSQAELLRTNFQAITHPDDLEEDLKRLERLKTGELGAHQLEKRYVRANGAIMWGVLSVGVVTDDEGRLDHFISQYVDVTEQHRLNQLKSEFVSTVSHELRTPLTSILGSLVLLSSLETEPYSDEVKRLLYIAQQNGDRLHALINDVLDFEKYSAGRMRFYLSKFRALGLVEEALQTNQALADRFGVRFALVSPDRKALCFVDPKRFQQVMTNLLSNAAKFAHAGSTIEVRVEGQEKAVRVSVTNKGEAIPVSFRSQIFQPFAQADPTSTRARGGTGLGLAITKQIVEQTQGEIGFDSAEGGPTTFWFTVPNEAPKGI